MTNYTNTLSTDCVNHNNVNMFKNKTYISRTKKDYRYEVCYHLCDALGGHQVIQSSRLGELRTADELCNFQYCFLM